MKNSGIPVEYYSENWRISTRNWSVFQALKNSTWNLFLGITDIWHNDLRSPFWKHSFCAPWQIWTYSISALLKSWEKQPLFEKSSPEAEEANFYLAVHDQIFDMIFEDSGLIFLGEPIIDESLSQTGFAYGSIPHYDHFDR